MVQIAILVLVAIIAVALAPWLFGLVAAAGVYIAAAAGIGLALGVAWGLFQWATSKREPLPETQEGQRVTCKNCQADNPAFLITCHKCGCTP